MDQRLERIEQMQIQMLEQLAKFQQDVKDQMLEVQRNFDEPVNPVIGYEVRKRKKPSGPLWE